MISTDKAVNPHQHDGGFPSGVAEMVVQSIGLASKTQFVSVRFRQRPPGPTAALSPSSKSGSPGGGPVTMTHPEMRRYFVTIREAVPLVLQAGTMGHGGEVFVLDMPGSRLR